MSENLHQELASGGVIGENYYDLFHLSPDSCDETIKKAYHALALKYHPDRSKKEDDITFSRLSHAYNILSDPIARSLYDIAQGYKEDSPEERRRINLMKRAQAIRQSELYEVTVSRIREEESAIDGLIIIEALYGDISVDAGERNMSQSGGGRCIDVTIPLQYAVKNSLLFKHASDSMSYLDGFYDPNNNEIDNLLYIRYLFQDMIHEVVYKDNESICIPLEEHYVGDENTDDEDSSQPSKNKSKLRNVNIKPRAQVQREISLIKAARRRKLYTILSTSVLTGALYYMQHYQIIDMCQWAPVKMITNLFSPKKEEE